MTGDSRIEASHPNRGRREKNHRVRGAVTIWAPRDTEKAESRGSKRNLRKYRCNGRVSHRIPPTAAKERIFE
jgi:hypothetical protein